MEAKKSFGDAIVSQELNKEAWKKLSREYKWNYTDSDGLGEQIRLDIYCYSDVV